MKKVLLTAIAVALVPPTATSTTAARKAIFLSTNWRSSIRQI